MFGILFPAFFSTLPWVIFYFVTNWFHPRVHPGEISTLSVKHALVLLFIQLVIFSIIAFLIDRFNDKKLPYKNVT